jgi:hypothetical protein
MKKALMSFCLMLCTGLANAGGLDIALSNNTAHLSMLLNPYAFYQGGGSELGVGAFVSEEGDKLAHATLIARGYRQSSSSQYSLGAGVKALYGDVTIPAASNNGTEVEEKVGAIAMGFQAGMLISSSRHNPIEAMFEGYIAPSITSFSDAERYAEINARLQIEIIPQAQAYVGYRRMRFNTRNFDNVRLDRSVHLGIKLTF